MIDTQSIKTTHLAQTRRLDGGKRVKGRKLHMEVDRLGLPRVVKVHSANFYDGKQAFDLLEALYFWHFSIERIGADGAYLGELAPWLFKRFQCQLEIASNIQTKGFQVFPKR